ncbi:MULTISPECIES: hypothetical protein [Pseudoxanthomonas]|uniref:Tetratricopeptide repeat protein n=1 Tax=Pseudoxanthomonas winnipegensis TaxID=2480810 RepID=A0AAW8GF21_9GAMM|nr:MULTISPECIES: hypothetical protein [Pseudoxanthomonas]MDQ1119629.1 hypothetical protein [Pseudoxanthomonas winnipegensis]MDQ1132824.1 hypothetical protein [Pseudoxanthomonas winnipegensis]MDR6137169.1 hypothetical protein [Pseudoxanthomonas sp. SORGH_AS_0997]
MTRQAGLSTGLGILLLALTAALYFPGLSGGFIFDDFPNLVLDTNWKLQHISWSEVQSLLHSGISSPAGRPLALLSFGLNYLATGLDPFALKLTSLVMHLVNGLLVWALVRRMVTLAGIRKPVSEHAAWAVTAVWLLHPIQVSTVLYVVQRMEIGAATGALAAVLAYVVARQRQCRGASAWPCFTFAVIFMLLGAGFKETALLTPGYCFLIEVFLLRFRTREGAASRGLILLYGVLGVAALAAFARWIALPTLSLPSDLSARRFTPWERLMTQGPVLETYLQQIVFPRLDSLTFYYDNFPVSRGWWSPPATAGGAALVIGLLAVAGLARRRWPLTGLGITWFFMGHALTSNILLLELAFQHRNYLPLLGIPLALVEPVQWGLRRLSALARAAVVLCLIAWLGGLCALEVRTWSNPARLDWTLENRNPGSMRATYALGARLLQSAQGDTASSRWSMAKIEFEKSASLPDPSPLPLQALILMESQAREPIPVSLWKRLGDALVQRPADPEALNSLHAIIQCRIEGRCALDDDLLMRTLGRVLDRNPSNPAVLTLYANAAWNISRDQVQAIALQRKAARLDPGVDYRVALAKFLLASGQYDEGMAVLSELELRPDAVSPEDMHALHELTRGASQSSDR